MQEALKRIRLELHRHMDKHFGTSVIWSDRASTVLNKPYATIKVISTNPEFVDTRDDYRWEDGDRIKYQVRYYKQILSVTVYQEDDQREINMDSMKLSNEIRRWFEIYGKIILEQLDVVLVEVGNVSDRTTFLVDSYDYKRGFDVTLRMTQTDDHINYYQENDTHKYDIIETVEVTPKGESTIIINKEE